MKVSDLISLAKYGRPDLAAVNLGATGAGAWRHPVRLLRVIAKYPHSCGHQFTISELAIYWHDGWQRADN